MARRTSVSCHFGIRKANNSRLMVEAKVENDIENLMGLIQGFTAADPAGINMASAAKIGTISRRAQTRRERTGSVASRSRKKQRTADGDSVCATARAKPET